MGIVMELLYPIGTEKRSIEPLRLCIHSSAFPPKADNFPVALASTRELVSVRLPNRSQ